MPPCPINPLQPIDVDAYWYLATLFVEVIIDDASEADPELVRCSDGMQAIETAHGLEDFVSFDRGEAPPEWRAFGDAWNARSVALQASFLRTHGLHDVADAFSANTQHVYDRSDVGHGLVWAATEIP